MKDATLLRTTVGGPPNVLPSGAWGGFVDRWNKLTPTERRAAAECRRIGHDYRMTNIGRLLCLRCCNWVGE